LKPESRRGEAGDETSRTISARSLTGDPGRLVLRSMSGRGMPPRPIML